MKYSYLYIANDSNCYYSLEYQNSFDRWDSNDSKFYKFNELPYLEVDIFSNDSKQYFTSGQLNENLEYELVPLIKLSQSQLVDWIKQQKYRVRLKQLGDI